MPASSGVDESALDALLKPNVPFDVQLADESENLEQSPVFACDTNPSQGPCCRRGAHSEDPDHDR